MEGVFSWFERVELNRIIHCLDLSLISPAPTLEHQKLASSRPSQIEITPSAQRLFCHFKPHNFIKVYHLKPNTYYRYLKECIKRFFLHPVFFKLTITDYLKKKELWRSDNLGIGSRITEFFMKTLLLNFDWISNIFLITFPLL